MSRNANFDPNNLQQRWVQVLRAKTKVSTTLVCEICDDKPLFTADGDFWHHVRKTHSERIPKEDLALKHFRDLVLSSAKAAAAKMRMNPSSELARLSKNGENIHDIPALRQNPISTEPAPLTTRGLEDLDKTQMTSFTTTKRQSVPEDTAPLDDHDHHAYKKLAFGMGKSPSSSITTLSQGSAPPARSLPASHRAMSSPAHHKGHNSMDFASRGPAAHGKHLFDPSDTPTPQPAQPTNLSSPGASSPGISTRPHQQFRNRRPQAQSVALSLAEKPSSSYAPGTLPGGILPAGKMQANQSPSLPFEHSRIISQPDTRPISQEQLVAEVKGIYAGLVMVEGKCIQVDLKQALLAKEAQPGTQPRLNNEQYQALIALHRTLLHEHHDFFLASQHPSATPAVRRLAVKYAMPARLWRHAIHSFLELLRNRLPASLDYMLEFIYLAYSMMTLLLETVPAFKDTWIECLGDLGRYRMAVEDDNVRDREVWTQVARQWYLKSANRSPTTGRLYHHLAILARPDALPQLLYYGKSLAVPIPFTAARESIMTLFEPTLNPKSNRRRFSAVITAFVRCHAIIFTGQSISSFSETLDEFISHLDNHIARITKKYLEQGYFLAISNCIALLGYGSNDNPLATLIRPPRPHRVQSRDVLIIGPSQIEEPIVPVTFTYALRLFNQTVQVHLQRIGDTNVLSFVHVVLVFMRHMSKNADAMRILEADFPWHSLVIMLNAVLRIHKPCSYSIIEGSEIPKPETPAHAYVLNSQNPATLDIAGNHDTVAPAADLFRPFPEEWAMQGLAWTEDYFPPGWFVNENVEEEKHYMEAESMRTEHRPERVLWLGCQIAKAGSWILYNETTHTFAMPGNHAPSATETDADTASDSGTLMTEVTAEGDAHMYHLGKGERARSEGSGHEDVAMTDVDAGLALSNGGSAGLVSPVSKDFGSSVY